MRRLQSWEARARARARRFFMLSLCLDTSLILRGDRQEGVLARRDGQGDDDMAISSCNKEVATRLYRMLAISELEADRVKSDHASFAKLGLLTQQALPHRLF